MWLPTIAMLLLLVCPFYTFFACCTKSFLGQQHLNVVLIVLVYCRVSFNKFETLSSRTFFHDVAWSERSFQKSHRHNITFYCYNFKSNKLDLISAIDVWCIFTYQKDGILLLLWKYIYVMYFFSTTAADAAEICTQC